jgi:hypothetical protein
VVLDEIARAGSSIEATPKIAAKQWPELVDRVAP